MRALHFVSAAIVGLALVVTGTLHLAQVQQRADRLTSGSPAVTARVVAVERAFWFARGLRVVRVEYRVAGRNTSAELIDVGAAALPVVGDEVAVHVDPVDPTRAATVGGLTAESPWAYWYWFAWTWGGVLMVWSVVRPIRNRRRGTVAEEPVSRSVVHLSPVRADVADGTALVILTIPDGSRILSDEVLAVRTVGPSHVEVCCIPFVAVRYALGDIAEVNHRGYLGAVVRPSGQVTFSVRMSDSGGDGSDIRSAASARGAVVESSTMQAFGVSLLGDEPVRLFHDYLDEAQAAGRLTYRSSVRHGSLPPSML